MPTELSLSCNSKWVEKRIGSNKHDCNPITHDCFCKVTDDEFRGLELEYVYEVYDFFIKKNNPNFIFFMMVALFGVQEREIMEAM